MLIVFIVRWFGANLVDRARPVDAPQARAAAIPGGCASRVGRSSAAVGGRRRRRDDHDLELASTRIEVAAVLATGKVVGGARRRGAGDGPEVKNPDA